MPQSMVASLERQYRISNIKTVPDGVELRILSREQPCSGAVLEPMTLEDIFLCHVGDTVTSAEIASHEGRKR